MFILHNYSNKFMRKMMIKNAKTALILVDIQLDFCPGGKLAVPGGDEIVSLANKLQSYFTLVVATQDWHPADHMSFASNQPGHKIGDIIKVNGISQMLWPDHCVQKSEGVKFHPALDLSKVNKIVYKGVDRTLDSYSAFFDNAHLRTTGLTDYLREQGIEDIYIMGLATDYCVKFSCLDAVREGFNVFIIEDACRGIDITPGDVDKAIFDMKKAGVKVVTTDIICNASVAS